MSDLRLAFRTLRRNPGFTAVVVMTLALGVGANTAIFSFVQAVLLRTLPVPAPGELFFVAQGPADDVTSTWSNYPYFERVREQRDVFDATLYQPDQFKISTGEVTEIVAGDFAGGSFHGVLGVPMALGRGFVSEDDRAGTSDAIAVISDAYWLRVFNRDPNVVGRKLVVQGIPVTIVGVTAPGFDGLTAGRRTDVTLPLALKSVAEPDLLTAHNNLRSAPIVVRLRPGVTRDQARAAVEAVFTQYTSEPENQWWRLTRNGQPQQVALLPAGRGSDSLRDDYSTALGVLMAIVGIVLAIGCANVANLLLARTAARSKEMAVRMSIGASRSRLVRQLLSESLLLAIAGGLAGFALAWWGTATISSLFAVGERPLFVAARPDGRVFAFTLGLSVLTGMLFGLVPALMGTRIALAPALKASGGSRGSRSRRWSARQILVCAQVALCVMLLAGAGLFIRTLRNLESRDVGFDRSSVLMFTLDVDGTRFAEERLPQLCGEVLDALRARTTVTAAACSPSVPVRGSGSTRALTIPGLPLTREPRDAFSNQVTPEYFRTFGLELLQGRLLTESDTATSEKVAVINQRLAREYFGDSDPLGRTLRFGTVTPREPMRIVGVVRDTVQDNNLRDEAPRMVFTPLPQEYGTSSDLTVSVRGPDAAAILTPLVRELVRGLSNEVVVDYIRTMDEQIDSMLVRERVLATLSSWFGVLALLLASVGLAGVMAYEVSRRTRDIGIRMALGAQPAMVLRALLREAALVALVGVAIGLAGSFATTRTLSPLLFGLSPRDPAVLTGAAALLFGAALAATYLPARRASRVDPMTALRSE